MKKKFLSGVKFTNGASYKCFFISDPPKRAKEANDYILVEMKPEPGRGDMMSFYMNAYDMNNLIYLLSNAILVLHEEGINPMP